MRYRKIIKRIVPVVISIIIFFFMGKNLYSNWDRLSGYNWNFRYSILLTSMLMLWIPHGLLALAWWLILKKLGAVLSFKKGLKINLLSQLGKYVPGKIWLLLGKMYCCSKEGISRKITFTSVILESALLLISGMLLMLTYISISRIEGFNRFILPSLLILIIGFVAIYPTIFRRIANIFLVRFRKQPIESVPNCRSILFLMGIYLMFWITNGFIFHVFLNSICTMPFSRILDTSGIMITSSVIGIVSILTPAGLGVREGAMALLLSQFFPLPVAIMLSLAHRLFLTVCELIFIGIVVVTIR